MDVAQKWYMSARSINIHGFLLDRQLELLEKSCLHVFIIAGKC